MGCFGIQRKSPNGQWQSNKVIDKNINCIATSEKWINLIKDFTETNYGIKLYFDQINTTLADMCVSNNMITHSVFSMCHV